MTWPGMGGHGRTGKVRTVPTRAGHGVTRAWLHLNSEQRESMLVIFIRSLSAKYEVHSPLNSFGYWTLNKYYYYYYYYY